MPKICGLSGRECDRSFFCGYAMHITGNEFDNDICELASRDVITRNRGRSGEVKAEDKRTVVFTSLAGEVVTRVRQGEIVEKRG